MYTIVIPCRDGAATLDAQLSALLEQEASVDFEVLVVDNGSTDGTADLVRSVASNDDRVHLIDASARTGINHARNRGVEAARGDRILLCDADDIVHQGWLAAHHAAFEAGAECVGGGLDRTLPDGTVIMRQRELLFVGWDLASPFGANCGFTREVYERIGGFDETFRDGGDDTDFFWRAALTGATTVLVPDAVVTYALRADLRRVTRQHINYGRGVTHLYVRHRASGMPRSSPIRAVLSVTACLLIIVTSGRRSLRRRFAVERLAGRIGRLRESVRRRTCYL
ncbi:glycosyl transferase [Plantibacter flavus]|uniref:glycosyltransferase n=1 Tax=Plantibacter flavus TaxID=150123 RepID=UPI0010C1BF3F|nr:glycosyltransferase [Plantibacter flavus]TKJ96506.1 glycosyl transferase [Plantibacter flavus]